VNGRRVHSVAPSEKSYASGSCYDDARRVEGSRHGALILRSISRYAEIYGYFTRLKVAAIL
jgi:hypothetical protein